MKHLLMAAVLVVASAGLTFGAALPADSSLVNPLVGGGGPFFSTTLPSYFTPANLVASNVCNYDPPLVGVAFTGQVTSTVYRNPGTGTLAFQYQWTNTTSPAVVDLIRSTIGDPNTNPWLGVAISNAGSDGSGVSLPTVATPNWSNGDPIFLLRDPTATGEGLTVQWRVANLSGQNIGTQLRSPSDFSARVFFETDATHFALTDVAMLDSGTSATCVAYAPSKIPEPATLLLLGLGGLPFLRRLRRHA